MSSNIVPLQKKGTNSGSSDTNEETRSAEPESFSGQLGELRRLIVEPEYRKLSSLEEVVGSVKEKLDDLPTTLGDALPSAITRSSQKDNKLVSATRPVVEKSIFDSVQRNPSVLAEALFPVFGPAIRKSISEALGTMVESLNKTMEHSLSPKGIGWRIEALRTGKSFAEVVLLKTLLFRVEQVFMIHSSNGVLLQHVESDLVKSKDPEMISGMLTAIQDFVQDSFTTEESGEKASLGSLRFSDFVVWIERSPDLIIAAAIRGNPPLSLREVFEETTEQLQHQYQNELDNFSGDTSIFEGARPVLLECLRYQVGDNEKKKKSKLFSPFGLLSSVLVVALLVAGFFYVRDWWQWKNYLSRLRSEPGIVVAEQERGWFTHSIAGLRDPQTQNPDELLAEFGFGKEDVVSNWREYQDLSPQFILERAKKVLNPPANVKLAMFEDVLVADGDSSAVQWFNESRKFAPAIGGVRDFALGFDTLKRFIESSTVRFRCGTLEYLPESQATLENSLPAIEQLIASGKVSGTNQVITIIGHYSKDGSDQVNSRLSAQRSEKVRNDILSKSPKLVQFAGNLVSESADDKSECAVSLKVKSQ